MFRIHLAAAGLLAASMGAVAQTTGPIALPVTGVKDAGTYELATGTWHRSGSAESGRSWDVIFDNTCSVGAYSPHPVTQRTVDDGRIPSTTSPTNPGPPMTAISWTGIQDHYSIGLFEIGYCTFDPLPTLEVSFWDCFTGCQDATLVTPRATIQLVNMPGAGGTALSCWTVAIDLVNSGLSFGMNADCDGVWHGGGHPDTFGWSWQQTSPSTGGTPGPIIAGDPLGYLNGGAGASGCDLGANTIFYGGSDPGSEGSGLDGQDMWEVDNMSPTPTYFICYWFGGYFNGNLYGSFHLKVAQEGEFPPFPGFPYCAGDGAGTQCPCGNNNSGTGSPLGGCFWGDPNFPAGGTLHAHGDPFHFNPNVTLVASEVSNDFGIFFGADNATNGGNGSPLNDGLRCAGGGLIRLTPPTLVSNNLVTHGPIELSDVNSAPGVTRRYQYWFRTPSGPCGQMANLTNGYEISWL